MRIKVISLLCIIFLITPLHARGPTATLSPCSAPEMALLVYVYHLLVNFESTQYRRTIVLANQTNKNSMASFTDNPEVVVVEPSSEGSALYRLMSSCEEMNPRRRSTMEDIHRVIPALGGDSQTAYFGVYDGHGGVCCVCLCLIFLLLDHTSSSWVLDRSAYCGFPRTPA